MIRFAQKDDIAGITSLWDTAFPEEPDFNKYFFKNIFRYSDTLINEENGTILTMAQMMPYEIKGIGKVTYIYGAATDIKCRNRGLMSELLKRSFEIDIENGIKASVLIPANKPLFDFYERLGYKKTFYCNKEKYVKGNTIEEARRAEYSDIPLIMKAYKGDIIRSEDYWKVQIDMYNSLGGSVFVYKNSYAVVSENIEELMAENEQEKKCLCDYVCRYLKKDSVEITEMGNGFPLGMMKKYDGQDSVNMYMNLMFN